MYWNGNKEQKENMKKYEKLIIKNEETEILNINDIKPLERFHDIHFHDDTIGENHAIVFSFFDNELKYKVAKLSRKADWIIREYEGELYLISLKKDC